MQESYNSVKLISERCIGCTDCIKRCPTEAIRVRHRKAIINKDRCIDCGVCVKVCDHRAKKAITEPISMINNYKYKAAVCSSTVFGQFKNIDDVNIILTAVKKLGFDDVFEVSRAAEMIMDYYINYINANELSKPIISSACPVIIRLISMRFPSLIENILPVLSPTEIAAKAAREYLIETGIDEKDIGIFFISPCASKATSIINPLGIEKSSLDGVIAIQDIYMPLLNKIKTITEPECLTCSTDKGMEWAVSGGQCKGLGIESAINVNGIENVITVLEEVENGQLEDVDFIEAHSCTGGCIGGPLNVVNSFVAKNNLRRVERFSKDMSNSFKRNINYSNSNINFEFTQKIAPVDVLKLDDDRAVAIKKLSEIGDIHARLPRIDCGACGAPTCYSHAEDIVRGNANIEDCIFMLRKKVKNLSDKEFTDE